MSAPTIDETRVEEFMGQLVGHMTGSALCLGIWLGDELGFYRVLAERGAMSADELAVQSECHERLVREWLDGQAAGGLLDYDDDDRHLRAPRRGRDGTRRRRVAGVRRTGDERVRFDVHRHREDEDGVPWGRGDVVGRPPPVPVLGHRVVLPHRLPGRAPDDWIPALDGVTDRS